MYYLSSHKVLEKYNEQVFYKKAVLKSFAIFTGKRLYGVFSFMKMQAFSPATLLKKASTQVFSCKYCKISKKTCFEKHL